MRKKGNSHEGERRHGQATRDHLTPAEVFILGPDVLPVDRLDGEGQGCLLRRGEKFLDAGAEAAKIRSPRYRQFAIHRSLGGRAGAEKVLQVIADAGTKGCLREGRILALAHSDRALREELPQVGPKIIGDENGWCIEFGYSRGGEPNPPPTARRRHLRACDFRGQKNDKFFRDPVPLPLKAESPPSGDPANKNTP